jgi:hypothetical protein
LFGSAAEFTRTYEVPLAGQPSGESSSALVQLKQRLRFSRLDAFILRREKTHLAGLPAKDGHKLEGKLVSEQRNWHLDIIDRAHTGGEGSHPLGLLHKLIERRRELATEFLAPIPIEDDLGRDLLNDVLGTPKTSLPELEWSHPLSRDEVRRLTPDRFEALIAVIEEQQGVQIILTPHAGDGGVYVIAMRHGQIRLIQCKHTLWDASVDAEVVAEVM